MIGLGGGSATAVLAVGSSPAGGASESDLVLALRGLALIFSRSTFSATSTEVVWAPELNHSLIVASRPAETTDMWVSILGISSALHLAMIALESIPRSFAMLCTRLVAKSNSSFSPVLRRAQLLPLTAHESH